MVLQQESQNLNQKINNKTILYQSQHESINKCDLLILDEYLSYSKTYKEQILNIVNKKDIDVLTISSADRVYNKPIFDIVRKYQTLKLDVIKSYIFTEYKHLENLESFTDDFINNELEYLQYNLLTYPNAKNITVDWFYKKDYDAFSKVMNSEEYKLTIKNEWCYNN